MISCMAAFYLVVAGLGAQAPDPDALYRQREDLASARKAIEVWAGRAAAGRDFDASWKLARACYWIGTHGDEAERRNARFGSSDGALHHLGWIHEFDASSREPSERQGGTWL